MAKKRTNVTQIAQGKDLSLGRGFIHTGARHMTILEERQFTNPHVRFVTIKGRVVPIFNRKRIGQTTDKIGGKAMWAGGALATAGLIKYAAKKRISKFGTRSGLIQNAKKSFGPAFSMYRKEKAATAITKSISTRKSLARKAARSAFKLAQRSGKFGWKNMGKVGIGLAAAGYAAKLGDSLWKYQALLERIYKWLA